MTFYQFIQRELDKHCSQCSETETFWVYRFDRKEYPYNVAFPKQKAENFTYYYGRAIRALALILDESSLHGLAVMAQMFDKENGNAQNES